MSEQVPTENIDKETKQIIRYIAVITCFVPVFIIGMYLFILWATWDFQGDFLRADRCLDSGGVWDRSVSGGKCWYAGECEDQGGYWYPAENRCVFER